MSLTDGAVAALAEQAATLVPLPVTVRIAPAAEDDPYRWPGSGSWTVYFDVSADPDDTVAIAVSGDDSPTWALYRLVDGLDELSETKRFRGQAFPRCAPGHAHPARVDIAGADVVLRCPRTGELVTRLAPP